MKWEPTEEQQRMAGYGSGDHSRRRCSKGRYRSRTMCAAIALPQRKVKNSAQVDWGVQVVTLQSNPVFVAYAERLSERVAL